MSAETDLSSSTFPGVGTCERRIDRPGVPLAAVLAVAAAAGASWYGFLEQAHGHPTVRLAGALALATGGLAAVLLAVPRLHQPAEPVPGGSPGLPASARLDGTRAVAAILGLLSMAAALIHFAVIEQHWTEYWLYGAFFIVTGLAQLAWAVIIPAAPTRLLLWAAATGNSLVVITWIITRTAGSLIGPAATTPAKAGFGDLVSTALEVLIVAGCAVLLARRPRAGARRQADHAPAITALIVVPFLVLALYSAVGGAPFVSMVG
jgi:hypothetical protein